MLMLYVEVRTFLNLLPSSEGDTEKFAVNQPLEVPAFSIYFSTISILNVILTVLYHRSVVCPIRWHRRQRDSKCRER